LVTQDVYSLHVYAFSLGLLCTRDFKQCPADPSERLLVLPSGPLSLFALCLPYPTGPLTHTRNHGGLVGCMIEINCYGPGSVGCIIEINCYGLRSADCMIEININGL